MHLFLWKFYVKWLLRFFSYTGCILEGKQLCLCELAICWSVAIQSCSLYTAAVQSKTHKGTFAIIFLNCRDLLNWLWNTCTYYIIFINHSYSIAWKTTFARYFEKDWCRLLRPPLKFQVNIKTQLNTTRVSRLSFHFLWVCPY